MATQQNRPWWTHPCRYGHFDCSYTDRGPCGDEAHPPEDDEVLDDGSDDGERLFELMGDR